MRHRPVSFDTEVPALVLRLDRNPYHHGTLGAARSLGRAGIEVHSLVESPRSPVNHSRFVHRAHDWPGGAPSAGRFVEALQQVSERIGRPAVLIPMDDRSAISTARWADRLADRYLLPRQSSFLLRQVADKVQLARLCEQWDVPHPRTVVPGSSREAAAAAKELGLPVVAKWSRPWLLDAATGLRSTSLVRTADEARRLFDQSGRAGSRLLLQRHLPGGRGTDWFYHGCFAGPAGCLIGGTGRKELAWPPGAGLTAVGRWLPNPQVEESAVRLATNLGYRGILDLDFRRDAEGKYHLLDFNPRPGAQFRLFTDRSGLDVVRALHLDLTGRNVTTPQPVAGRLFVAENYALLSALAAARKPRPRAGRAAAAAETAATGRERNAEAAWFAADDPAPFFAMAAGWTRRAGRKGLERLRRTRRPPAPTLRPVRRADDRPSQCNDQRAGASCTTW
ncbi:carboxylate--amine ligase [Streptomyces meridianus]|uniref:ATP-grasp domain-containing protein n=1 Tax=Streptomyces meridianus TaxID=2938945 RepID=A0ABT0X6T8_9ACTN|nr:ATP-grasp domain-containing protein [Streptomyces meridianus]MCM2578243.1 ATP-grasp domain-containing protein [Streptomyces meridianus]